MQMNPYLSFNGRCEEAFRCYERAFGAQLGPIFRYGGSQMGGQVPPDWRDKVMHASLTLEGQLVMGADIAPGQFEPPKGFSMTLTMTSEADAERIFDALSKDGSIVMALQKTFWAARFGQLVDRFGIPWTINCGEPTV